MAPPRRPRQTDPSSRSTARSTPLPSYQPPSHPLNTNAQRALHELPRSHRVDGLQTHLAQAINNLTAAAGDINDRSQQKLADHQKRKARRLARDGVGPDEDENDRDRAVEEMRENAAELTAELEQRVRKIVDAKAAVENVTTVLRELDANLSNGQGVVAPTQSTLGASQLRENGRRPNVNLSDEEDEAEELSPAGPLGVLKQKIDKFHSEYENTSMRHRYASNNDYIGFKKIVHDACHPQHDAPPVPHPSTWFPNSESSSPNHISSSNNNNNRNNRPNSDRNNAQNAAAAAATTTADDDDEIEVASERISINCPLTLRPMQVPVSSSICPHSFEQAAILEMISQSPIRLRIPNPRAGQPGVERQMKCPVSGCNAMLSPSLLHHDAILLRKIKRRLQAPSPSPSPSPSPPPSSQPHPPPSSSSRSRSQLPPRQLARPSSQSQRSQQIQKFKKEVSMIPATQLEPEPELDESGLEEMDEDEEGEEEEEEEEEDDEEEEGEEEEEEVSRTQIVDLE